MNKMKSRSILRVTARTMRRDHKLTGRKFKKIKNLPTDYLDSQDCFRIDSIYKEAIPAGEYISGFNKETIFLEDFRGYGFYCIAEEFELTWKQ